MKKFKDRNRDHYKNHQQLSYNPSTTHHLTLNAPQTTQGSQK